MHGWTSARERRRRATVERGRRCPTAARCSRALAAEPTERELIGRVESKASGGRSGNALEALEARGVLVAKDRKRLLKALDPTHKGPANVKAHAHALLNAVAPGVDSSTVSVGTWVDGARAKLAV